MKIGIGQINPTIGDFVGNRQLILSAVEQAHKEPVDLVVFPEMSLCGYPPNDLLDHAAFADENLKSLRVLQHNFPEDIAVAIGYVDRNRRASGKPLTNSVAVIAGGKIVFKQAKTLLPTYDVFDEARYFEPATERGIFDFAGERIGFALCEDLWWEVEPAPGTRYSIDPVQDLLDEGATVIVSPSASPFFDGKIDIRTHILSKIGRSSGVPVVYVNMVGGNDNLIFDGRSMVSDREGNIVHLSPAFQEYYTTIDLDSSGTPVSVEPDRYREMEQALILGIRDYLRKTGFSRVHLALSGGIDSALVVALATEAVGKEHISAFGLPSRYSSEGSVTHSRELCRNLGIRFEEISIEGPFSAFLDALEPHFRGLDPDVTEENLQARTRGLLMMAYSNKFGSLLLATGNKSEFATGYATLYGDMCGSIAVIGDLFKTDVYGLCRYINSRRPTIPEAILTKPPSAELRPDQHDSDSLPEYDVLDTILHLYLLENLTGREIAAKGFDPALVERVLTLVGRSEYKRRQAPPVLKVSARAFGTGRRMPIARTIYESGGVRE